MSLSLFLSLSLSCSRSLFKSWCIISLSNDKDFSDTEFTVYSCTNNFIMLFKLCIIFKQLEIIYIYICIPFDLQVNAVGSVQVEISHFWFLIFTL